MKFLISFLLVTLTSCSSLNAYESSNQVTNDYYILMSNFLNLNENRYFYLDSNGKKQTDELKVFKELEGLYVRYIEPDLENKKFSEKQLKIVMFFSYYAEQHNSSAFLEYLAADLMPVYVHNSQLFLKILNDLPFLAAANCSRLNSYFGFEDKNADLKPSFINNNFTLWDQSLDSKINAVCQQQLK